MGMAALIFLAKFLLVFQPVVAVCLLLGGECSSRRTFLKDLFIPGFVYVRISLIISKMVWHMYKALD